MFPKLNETKIENASTPKSDYLGAGAHTVEIRKFKTSDEVPGYQGTPYTEFMVGNDEGIGATTFQDPHMACNSVINNKIEVCLAKREYWTTDKDTNIPQIKSRVEYKFANPSGKKITFKDSYNKPMSAEDRARYEEALRLSQGSSADIQTPF